MKLIEALKKTKDLAKKADDIKLKIAHYHVDYESETPTYGSPQDQRQQVRSWLQMHGDIVKEISDLRYWIQKTNVSTQVEIEIGGNKISKTITEWIFRRKDLAKMQLDCWTMLSDKNLKPVGTMQKTSGETVTVNLRRYYDPKERDEKREIFRSEPSLIDAKLEVVNAITDLVC